MKASLKEIGTRPLMTIRTTTNPAVRSIRFLFLVIGIACH
jgi:hypothetical protein